MTVEKGIPITTVARTIFDIAARFGTRAAERALHESEVRRLADHVPFPLLVDRYPNHRGVRNARSVLAAYNAGIDVTHEGLEEDFREFLIARGFPMPEFNSWLQVRDRMIRPDCVWRDRRVIVELDGRAVHDTARNSESDKGRDRAAVAAGWRVVRVTWRQLHEEPDELAADLWALVGS
jgi:hypothetical protein